MIARRLQVDGVNFVLLERGGKKPFQKEWQNKIIRYDDPQLLSHISNGGNYGVMGGGDAKLLIVDFDNADTQAEIVKNLPETFTVKTGRGLLHKYFKSDRCESFKIFDSEMNTLLDVQGEGKQVVGPGSIHPNGNYYEVIDDREIAFISHAELEAIIKPYDKKPAKKEKIEDGRTREYSEGSFLDTVKSRVNIKDILNFYGIDTSRNPCACPFHDSKGGKCLGFNDETAHCFHCDGSWNIFSMVREMQKCDFRGALLFIVDKFGLKKDYEADRANYLSLKNKVVIQENIQEPVPHAAELPQKSLEEIFEEMVSLYKFYMDLPIESIKLHALYDIATYFHSLFSSFPHLFVNAMKGSGKTRLLQIHAHLTSANGRVHTGVNQTTLFRTPKDQVLIFDECENIAKKEKEELRQYINVCYKRGATVERYIKVKTPKGEEYMPEFFEPFKPIIMANINGMDEVVNDRCLATVLEKSNNANAVKKFEDFEENKKFREITELLKQISVVMPCRYVKKHINGAWNNYIDQKYGANDSIPNDTIYNNTKQHNDTEQTQADTDIVLFFKAVDKTKIDGRNLELWFPLLLVAREISENLFYEMISLAQSMTKTKNDNDFAESRDIALFDFIASLSDNGLQYLSLKDLTYRFRTYLGTEYGEDNWINEKWFGRALNRLQLVLSKKREASGRLVILNYAKAKEKIKIFKSEGEADK